MKTKHLLIALAGIAAMAPMQIAFADANRPLYETMDQARQRHNAERYETYRQNGYQAPLGGYRDRLGDPAPMGTDRPGMSGAKGSLGTFNGRTYQNNGHRDPATWGKF